jgi:hypothetical protein
MKLEMREVNEFTLSAFLIIGLFLSEDSEGYYAIDFSQVKPRESFKSSLPLQQQE